VVECSFMSIDVKCRCKICGFEGELSQFELYINDDSPMLYIVCPKCGNTISTNVNPCVKHVRAFIRIIHEDKLPKEVKEKVEKGGEYAVPLKPGVLVRVSEKDNLYFGVEDDGKLYLYKVKKLIPVTIVLTKEV